jgi:arylsulfatase A-like enzyme
VGVVVGWVAAFVLALGLDERLAEPPGILALTAACVLASVAAGWLPRRRFCVPHALALAPMVLVAALPLPHLFGDPWLVRELGGPVHDPSVRSLAAVGALTALAIGSVVAGAVALLRGAPAWWVEASSRTVAVVMVAVHVGVVVAAGGLFLLRTPDAVQEVADPALPEAPAVVAEATGADLVWTTVRSSATGRRYQTAAHRFESPGELILEPNPRATELEFFCADAHQDRQHLVLAPLGLVHRRDCGATVQVTIGDQQVTGESLVLSEERRLKVPVPPAAAGPVSVRVEPHLGCTVLVHRVGLGTPPEVPRRVVLISLDTHASQHMRFGPLSEAALDTSPSLRGLVAQDELAVGFTHAVAAADWTLPSHASVWSGLRPSQHRLFLREPVTSFDERIATLPQLLRDGAGVRTLALVSHLRLGPDYGFARGVEFASLYEQPLGQRGRRVVEDALTLLDEHRDEDLLLFVHLFDAHTPYTNFPEGHEQLVREVEPHYPERLYTGRFYRETVKGKEGMDPRVRSRNLRRHGEKFAEKMDAARVAYQLGIRDVDDMLGVFLSGLRDLGLYDSTDLVLFSDHGEEFFGHGLLTHTSLYLENVRVPVIVKVRQDSPYAAAAREAPPYVPSTFEAHPTVFRVVLDLFGVAPPPLQSTAGGLDLLELLTLSADRSALSELHAAPYSEMVQLSNVCGNASHGIVTTYPEDAQRWTLNREYFELYASLLDREERHNLADGGEFLADPCLDEALEAALEQRELPYRSQATRGLTDDEIARLRALGYLE